MNQAELLTLGVIPCLALVAAIATFADLPEKLAQVRAQVLAADQALAILLVLVLMLIVSVISFSDFTVAFAIQNHGSASTELNRINAIRIIVAMEILAVTSSAIAACFLRKRWGGSLAMALLLGVLGNIGALIWMIRRRLPQVHP